MLCLTFSFDYKGMRRRAWSWADGLTDEIDERDWCTSLMYRLDVPA